MGTGGPVFYKERLMGGQLVEGQGAYFEAAFDSKQMFMYLEWSLLEVIFGT